MVDEMAPGSGEPSRSGSSASPAGRNRARVMRAYKRISRARRLIGLRCLILFLPVWLPLVLLDLIAMSLRFIGDTISAATVPAGRFLGDYWDRQKGGGDARFRGRVSRLLRKAARLDGKPARSASEGTPNATPNTETDDA